MPVELLDLPAELQHMFLSRLTHHSLCWRKDAMALSATCQYYRYLLVPYIFRFLIIHNTKASAGAALAISKTSLRNHVKEINITPRTAGDGVIDEKLDALGDDITITDLVEVMPRLCAETWVDEYGQVLSTLGLCFPNVGLVTVDFDLGEGDSEWFPGSEMLSSEEDEERRESLEMDEPWRMLLNRTYDALARGCNHASSQVKTLDLLNVPPVEASALRTPHFRQFLGRLSNFNVLMWGATGFGINSNTLEGTRAFPAELGNVFFKHLKQCTTLYLQASWESPLGLKGGCHIPLSLKPKMMPLLRDLVLEHLFIDGVLCKFLEAHSGTLETVELCNCFANAGDFDSDLRDPFASIGDADEAGIPWSVLFSRVADSNPARLKKFNIRDPGFDDDLGTYLDSDDEEAEEERSFRSEAAKVKKILGEDKSKKLFRYVSLDRDSGVVVEIIDSLINHFLDGHDQMAYNRLTNLMRKNS